MSEHDLTGSGNGDGDGDGDGSAKDDSERPAADSLTEALDDLEQLLGSSQTAPSEHERDRTKPTGHGETGQAQSGLESSRERFLAAQYDIPLLNDVVVPGSAHAQDQNEAPLDPVRDDFVDAADQTQARSTEEDEMDSFGEDAANPPQPDPQATALALRLASELEVIVDTKAKAAMRDALEEIKREVSRHIQIVLPEILDELAQKNLDKE